MNIKTGLLGVTVTGALLLMASCGGSSDSNNNSGGGSSSASGGSGGSATAGSSSSAGKTSSNGGTSSNNGGTSSNNGGTRAMGGFTFGGNFSFGGGGFDPSDFACNPKPTVGAMCAAGTRPCADGTNVCYCQNEKWACVDLAAAGDGGAGPGGFGQIECPAEQPMMGEACDGFGFCQYGAMQGCACFNGMWMCN